MNLHVSQVRLKMNSLVTTSLLNPYTSNPSLSSSLFRILGRFEYFNETSREYRSATRRLDDKVLLINIGFEIYY